MQLTENFRLALQDYTLLLNKKYPEKTILEMVSTRYALNHFERSMLYRGITKNDVAERRRKKLVSYERLNNSTLHIDLFNVIFTIAAYLRGFPIYFAKDGLLRDASESHGSDDWEVHLDKGLDLMLEYVVGLNIEKAIFYIDNPLNYGLAISEKLKDISKITEPVIKIITDPSPDHLIKEVKSGIIATSDSTIIDKSNLPVFDLPDYILESSFNPHILSLSDFQLEEK